MAATTIGIGPTTPSGESEAACVRSVGSVPPNMVSEYSGGTAQFLMMHKGADIASASTCSIGAAGTYPVVTITGTTTITAFGTVPNDDACLRFVTFAAALTLTYNPTSLILPGAANVTTAAGDTAVLLHTGSGNWRCLSYTRAASGPAAVASVSNSDGSLTISPTTGAVVASLNVGHANTWTAQQYFYDSSIATSILKIRASGASPYKMLEMLEYGGSNVTNFDSNGSFRSTVPVYLSTSAYIQFSANPLTDTSSGTNIQGQTGGFKFNCNGGYVTVEQYAPGTTYGCFDLRPYNNASGCIPAIRLHPQFPSPTTGSGSYILFAAQDTTTNDVRQGEIQSVWLDPTHATFRGGVIIGAHDVATLEGTPAIGFQVAADGTGEPQIAFYGNTPVLQPSSIDYQSALSNSLGLVGSGMYFNYVNVNLINALTTTKSTSVDHRHSLSSGTAANGIGTQQRWYCQSTAIGNRQQLAQEVSWTDATDASRASRCDWRTYGSGGSAITLSIGHNGTAAIFSVFNATPIVRQTGDIGTAIASFGFMSGTPTFASANLTGQVAVANGGTGGTTAATGRNGLGIYSGSVSQVGVATTIFTVTIGATLASTSYQVSVTPTVVLAAAAFYVTNKTTTTFDVTFLAGLTGTVTFDWQLII